ncbi:MAG: ribosome assembly RNA-binding protein YhbY [Proteobacteria bacterium]|nr:ribosome assembly RNA-binding protein YhbY [Pseudomonadota bacterium]MDA1331677.1 ribosome assembly RNA-binding protein YhbY [Pseudomonadota bacterium]
MNPISDKIKRELRAKAHHLNPVVTIGDKGLSKPVLKELSIALDAHELIKVRIHSDDREEREKIMSEIVTSLGATSINHIGKVLIVYRRNEKNAD